MLILSGCDVKIARAPTRNNSTDLGVQIHETTANDTTVDSAVESSDVLEFTDSHELPEITEPKPLQKIILSSDEIIDGPSILDVDDFTYIYGDKSNRKYQPELSVPSGNDPYKRKTEEEAKKVCDEYFQLYCQSMSQKEELDLSSLYDLSNDIRVLDWEFNQVYIYGDLRLKVQDQEDFLFVSYGGSNYYYNWDEWNLEQDNGVLVVHTKTLITWHYTDGFKQQSGGKDFPLHTHEFALTRVDGQLKVIRYRDFDLNYMGLQQRMAERPEMAKNMDEFRSYLDDYYETLFG